jgi:hypothetical protein
MSNYYSQLSSLFYHDKKQEINLTHVLTLTDPPTNKRIQKLVQSGILKNVHYRLNGKSTELELVKNHDQFTNQFDSDYIHFKNFNRQS